ncbi:MAG TPA: tetratricopeptide repeat protein, partial [Pyrinomonadaceae bacterium]|nr:tetratricopeptide repeat protein [Pyrinomonadaceae bacterium]
MSPCSRPTHNSFVTWVRIVLAPVAIALCLFMVTAAQDDDRSTQAVALFNSGQDAHEKGDLATAIQQYEKAIKLIPEFPEAHLQRGNAYLSLAKLDEAERAFRRAVELRDDWSLALASLGGVLVRKGNLSEAETILSKAIELDEQNFPAYAAMTELRLKTKADAKVLNALLGRLNLLTLKANPTASIWASRAAVELALGDTRSAKLSAARAIGLDAKSQFGLSTSAEVALRENDPAAADLFVKRLEAENNSEEVKAMRARVLVAQGHPNEAIALLTSITQPGSETITLKSEIVASVSTNPTDLEKQLVTDPKNGAVLSKLCNAFRTRDPARALDYCRRASEAAPQSVEPVIGYAAALVQAKRYDEAVVVLRRIAAIAPDNSTVRANLGTALFQLKRYAEAKTEFRWLTDHRPDHAAAYYFL